MGIAGSRRRLRMAVVPVLLLLLAGCASVRQTGADLGLRFVEKHLIPPVLGDDDIPMACINGQAFAPIVLSLGPTGLKAETDQLLTLLNSTAAVCAEQEALENELRYMRAIRNNNGEEADDARIVQKRWLAVASRRQYKAYQTFDHYYTRKYGIEIGESCPTFSSELDEMVFMLGAISGLQSIVNDIGSGNAVGVPQDIAGRTGRAMGCLDNKKWWGVPRAVQAAIWNLMPGGGPADPWLTLQDSMTIGKAGGVRLAHAIYALSAFAKDDQPHLVDAFRSYAAAGEDPQFTASTRYRVFDRFSELILLGLEDRYWAAKAGTRIPADERCFCHSAAPATPSVNVDDLL
jgi:hypothetical protein